MKGVRIKAFHSVNFSLPFFNDKRCIEVGFLAMSHQNLKSSTDTSQSKVPFMPKEPFSIEATTQIFATLAPAVREKFNDDPEKWNAAMNESITHFNSLSPEYTERLLDRSKAWHEKVVAYGKETGDGEFQAKFKDLMSKSGRTGYVGTFQPSDE
jgi:hypothetical protein